MEPTRGGDAAQARAWLAAQWARLRGLLTSGLRRAAERQGMFALAAAAVAALVAAWLIWGGDGFAVVAAVEGVALGVWAAFETRASADVTRALARRLVALDYRDLARDLDSLRLAVLDTQDSTPDDPTRALGEGKARELYAAFDEGFAKSIFTPLDLASCARLQYALGLFFDDRAVGSSVQKTNWVREMTPAAVGEVLGMLDAARQTAS